VILAWMKPLLMDRAMAAAPLFAFMPPSSLSHSGSPVRRAARVDSHRKPVVTAPHVSCTPITARAALNAGSLAAAAATCQALAGLYGGPAVG
jgi:hypothetical protein